MRIMERERQMRDNPHGRKECPACGSESHFNAECQLEPDDFDGFGDPLAWGSD